ncbi:DUF2157 domain-containing protein [Nocardioides pocheonensis]|uniref:DUF2157 domain-containing protein n=1 Tax=Nocardioides pocheonensis TaxID=661485 RepID=UPI0011CE2F46|nr:DUF2157 domain-containing protein [Nocardioides pocheonensis]
MRHSDAAERVVHALEDEGLLASGTEERSRAIVERALAGPAAGDGAPAMPKLVEVVAYLGAALVLAAGFLFLLRSWDDLGDVGQVSFLAAVAVVLGVGGVVTAPRGERVAADVRRRLGGTLLTGSAVAAGFTVGVALDVFTDLGADGISWPLVAGGLVTCAGAALGYRVSSTAVGLLGMVVGVLAAVTEIGSSLADQPARESLGVGTGMFAVAAVWVFLTEHGAFEQVRVARSLGVVTALFGAQAAAVDGLRWVGYLYFVVVVAVGVWLYLTRLDWPYLAAAVIAVTLVVPEAVSDWTEGSLGVVGGVLVAGITLLTASFAGYRLRHRDTT